MVKKIVVQLADWLNTQQPTLKGFDRRSLYRMRDFFDTWQTVDWSLVSPNAANEKFFIVESSNLAEQKIVGLSNPQSFVLPAILAKVSWTHHIEILKRATSVEERLFYLVLSIKDRYTILELVRQIKSALFERQMLAKQSMLVPEHPKKKYWQIYFETAIYLNFWT